MVTVRKKPTIAIRLSTLILVWCSPTATDTYFERRFYRHFTTLAFCRIRFEFGKAFCRLDDGSSFNLAKIIGLMDFGEEQYESTII